MDSTYRVLINLAYDGTDYFGWQIQPHSEPTLQGVLEKFISRMFNAQIGRAHV